jgi:thiamine kinase-like enzyme
MLYLAVGFSDSTKSLALQKLNLASIQQEYIWLRTAIQKKEASVEDIAFYIDSDIRQGMKCAFETVLCHNDLLSGNILLSQSTDTRNAEVTIIDYEYTAYNYRAFDIANHFIGKL